jgi:hypothetical protein
MAAAFLTLCRLPRQPLCVICRARLLSRRRYLLPPFPHTHTPFQRRPFPPPPPSYRRLFSAHLHNLREPTRQLQSCFYVVLWNKNIYVTEVPLRDNFGKLTVFGKLGENAVEQMKSFHDGVMAASMFMGEMPFEHIPKVGLDWRGVDAALQSLAQRTARHDARGVVVPSTVTDLYKEVKAEDDMAMISAGAAGRLSFLQQIGAADKAASVLAWLQHASALIKGNRDFDLPPAAESSVSQGHPDDLGARVADIQSAICLSAFTNRVAHLRGVHFSSLSVRAFGNVALRDSRSLQQAYSRAGEDGNAAWADLVAKSVQHGTTPLVILAAENLGSGVASCLLASQQDLWLRIFRQGGDVDGQREELLCFTPSPPSPPPPPSLPPRTRQPRTD